MRAVCRLEFAPADGGEFTDITSLVTIESVSVQDQKGFADDRLNLALGDPDGRLPVSGRNTRLRVALGWEDAVVSMGVYHVSEVAGSSPPSVVSISATGLRGGTKIREHRTRQWGDIRLEALAGQIGRAHGLKVRVGDNMKNLIFYNLSQQNQSDIGMLRELVRQSGGDIKLRGDVMVITEISPNVNALGQSISSGQVFSPQDCQQYSWNLEARAQYSAVVAQYQTTDQETLQLILGDSKGAIFRDPKVYNSYQEARQAAFGRMQRFDIQKLTCRLTLSHADTTLSAGIHVGLKDFPSPFSGSVNDNWGLASRTSTFVIKSVTHSLNKTAGLQTAMELQLVADATPLQTSLLGSDRFGGQPPSGSTAQTALLASPGVSSTSAPSGSAAATPATPGGGPATTDCSIDGPFSCRLTPNFQYGNFTRWEERRRFTAEYQMATAMELATFLERLHARWPIYIESPLRTVAINRQNRGAPDSEHLFQHQGTGAVDIGFRDNPGSVEWAMRENWIRQHWPYSVGTAAFSQTNLTHVGRRRDGNRRDWSYS